MGIRYRFLKAFLLLALGLFLLGKINDGTIFYYINQRFVWLTFVGGLIFVLLGVSIFKQKYNEHHHHDHAHAHDHDEEAGFFSKAGPILVVSIPLLLGVFVPARPLDNQVIENRGISYSAPLSISDSQTVAIDQPSDSRNILDWIRAFNYSDDPAEFSGESASVVGFVYHDLRLPENQFMVGRIAVTCCVADAFAIGMVVESPNAAEMIDNRWVHVEGIIDVTSVDGWDLPLILAEEITPTDAPPQPYIYP